METLVSMYTQKNKKLQEIESALENSIRDSISKSKTPMTVTLLSVATSLKRFKISENQTSQIRKSLAVELFAKSSIRPELLLVFPVS